MSFGTRSFGLDPLAGGGTGVAPLGLTVSDDRGLTDGTQASVGSASSDSRGSSDVLVVDVGSSVTDDRGLTDAATPLLTAAGSLNLTDERGLSDDATPSVAVLSSVDERGLSDSIVTTFDLAQDLLDDRGLTDAATPSLTGPTALTLTVTDLRGLTDLGTAALGVTQSGTVQVATFGLTPGNSPVAQEMELSINDPVQDRAPTALNVTLSGAVPGETITFAIDGSDVWTLVADGQGGLFLVSIPVPARPNGTTDLAAGTHTLTATGSLTASATFTMRRIASPFPSAQDADIDAVAVTGLAGRWALQDPKPGGLGTWIMSPSPSTMTEPELAKVVDVEHSTATVDGQYHIWVADIGTKDWQWTGYCPDQTFYDKLKAFSELNRRFYVIDHRGRAWKSTILRADVRARKRQVDPITGAWNDWAHDYTVTAVVYDVGWTEPV